MTNKVKAAGGCFKFEMTLDEAIRRLDVLNKTAWIILVVQTVAVAILCLTNWIIGCCVVVLLITESRGRRISEEANEIKNNLMSRNVNPQRQEAGE